jgi:hypothetical protein
MVDEQTHEVEAQAADPSREQLAKIQMTLEEILQQLKQQARLSYHRDFSYSKLIGAIAQLLVIAVLFWTLVGLPSMEEISIYWGTLLKLMGGVLLQLVALTFFFLDHQNR